MRLRFYKHDVDFVDLELGGAGNGDEIHYRVILYSAGLHWLAYIRPLSAERLTMR